MRRFQLFINSFFPAFRMYKGKARQYRLRGSLNVIPLYIHTIKTPGRFLFLMLTLLALSCSKSETSAPGEAAVPLVTAAGTPSGTSITKTIDASGGSITSADSNIIIIVPAGALTEAKTITVQPVSNQLPAGYGKAYRLTPHDISFQQPVTIRFRYDETAIRNTVPELLGVAYQDKTGRWMRAAEPTLDKANHLLSVNTTHFSDWGYFPYFFIEPGETVVDPGAQLDLKVLATIPEDDVDVPDPSGGPVTQSYQPGNRYLGAWSYAGEGSLNGNGNKAHYMAPNIVPKINPEAISVAVNMKRKGQFQLVSNITIRTDFHIDYMQVDETEENRSGLNYPSRLWLYGSFGEDPGKGKRSVKINNGEVTVAIWSPGYIACDIPTAGSSSSGMVEITSGEKTTSKLLNEWLVDLYYDKVESPGGALTKKINFVLRFRGDAEGYLRQGQKSWVEETDLHNYSKAVIQMPAGSFTNHVTMDACGDYTVQWDQVQELRINRKKYTEAADGLRGRVVHKPEGFDVKLYFIAVNALMTHRKFVDCRGTSTRDDVPEDIEFRGFHEVAIPLRFSKPEGNATIKAGEMPLIKGSNPAAGLYFDAPDYITDNFTIRLHWDEARPKFE